VIYVLYVLAPVYAPLLVLGVLHLVGHPPTPTERTHP
jgi:hypothetical protein